MADFRDNSDGRVVLRQKLGASWKQTLIISMSLLIGVVIAWLALHLHFWVNEFGLTTTRTSYALDQSRRDQFLIAFYRNLGVTLFSFNNVFWVLVIQVSYIAWWKDRSLFLCITFVNIIVFGIYILVHDISRIYCLIMWPFIVLMLIHSVRTTMLSLDELKELVVLSYVLSFVIPKLILWAGNIHSTTIFYDLRVIGDKLGLDFSKGECFYHSSH